MIVRKNRFHGHHAVSRVRGRSSHGELISVRTARTNRKEYRLAVVVSKKVDSRAVVRNRIRRRIFEAVRMSHLLEGRAVDAVVYVKDVRVATCTSDELVQELVRLFKKALLTTSA